MFTGDLGIVSKGDAGTNIEFPVLEFIVGV